MEPRLQEDVGARLERRLEANDRQVRVLRLRYPLTQPGDLLGRQLRHASDELEIDPVLDPSLGTVRASVPLAGGRRAELEIVTGDRGHGVTGASVDGTVLDLRPLANPYREPGVAVRTADLGTSDSVHLRVVTG